MTGYTSGKTTHDPEPYCSAFPALIRHRHPARATIESCIYGPGCEYRPRPECDNHNPILADLRDYWAHHGPKLSAWHAARYLDVTDLDAFDVAPEHIDHALRVLTKLAALTNGVTD